MNNNLTVSTLAFNLGTSDKAGSERREVSRGINLPTVMTVKHQPYVDSQTKVPGTRSVVRFDRYVAGSARVLACSAYMVVTTPGDALITGSDVLAVVGHLINTLETGDGKLGLAEEIFVNREQ